MARFLKYSGAAFVAGILFALALTVTYAHGYRQGTDDAIKTFEELVAKYLMGGNPKYQTGLEVPGK